MSVFIALCLSLSLRPCVFVSLSLSLSLSVSLTNAILPSVWHDNRKSCETVSVLLIQSIKNLSKNISTPKIIQFVSGLEGGMQGTAKDLYWFWWTMIEQSEVGPGRLFISNYNRSRECEEFRTLKRLKGAGSGKAPGHHVKCLLWRFPAEKFIKLTVKDL